MVGVYMHLFLLGVYIVELPWLGVCIYSTLVDNAKGLQNSVPVYLPTCSIREFELIQIPLSAWFCQVLFSSFSGCGRYVLKV